MSIEVENVYLGALRGATLSLVAGSLSTVVARPGDGLSELAEVLAGVVRPTRGKVRVLGGDPYRRPDVRALSASLLPREPGMTEGTVGEWVRGVLTARGGDTAGADLGGLFELSNVSARQTVSLDSAERRRVAAALALSHGGARAHILYEPYVGLPGVDQSNTCIRLEAARQAGSTVVVLTANPGLAGALEGETYLLRDGAIVDSSTHSPDLVSNGPAQVEVASPDARKLARRLLAPGADTVDLKAVTDDLVIIAAETQARAASALAHAAGTEPWIQIHSVRRVPEDTRQLQLRSAAERQHAYDQAYAWAARKAEAEQAWQRNATELAPPVALKLPAATPHDPPIDEGSQ